jgi:histidine kinase/DNA gyrase B/HSP90-like ATPase
MSAVQAPRHNSAQTRIVSAKPTKAFFIENLIRDIELPRAIADLVDNSIDGARRLRPNGKYKGLSVRIDFSPKTFEIVDNCGGMEVELARTYAFNFGRDRFYPGAVRHSIGQFGVGMKRALFKLGKKFTVESRSATHTFSITVDVDKWKDEPDWTFAFDEEPRRVSNPPEKRGTRIVVTKLNDSVVGQFDDPRFVEDLRETLAVAEQFALVSGLSINVLGKDLTAREPKLRSNKTLRPGVARWTSSAGVKVELYAGVDEAGDKRNRREAGWYVFCNGRVVLRADQSRTTGWDTPPIPAFHPQFARFRGYAFFESDEPALLPWNTTKTGVEPELAVYQQARQRMIDGMRPVIEYLNENKDTERSRKLAAFLQRAPAVAVRELGGARAFAGPQFSAATETPADMTHISYDRPTAEYQRARKLTGERTPRKVGEATFEYFLRSKERA